MYSRFFGLGLVKMMDIVGIEQNADETYPVMEEWMGTALDKPFYTACVSQVFIVLVLVDVIDIDHSIYPCQNLLIMIPCTSAPTPLIVTV